MARPERDARIQLDVRSGHELEADPLRHRRQHELRLHAGESVSDAHARAGAERKVRGPRRLPRKALRIEPLRIARELRMPVHHLWTGEADRSRRDLVPADLVRTLRGPADDPRRGIE